MKIYRKKETYGAGNLYTAYRTVRKGGYVDFDGNRFQHDLLKPYAGERVFVRFEGDSPFAIGPILISDWTQFNIICRIERPINS